MGGDLLELDPEDPGPDSRLDPPADSIPLPTTVALSVLDLIPVSELGTVIALVRPSERDRLPSTEIDAALWLLSIGGAVEPKLRQCSSVA